MSHPRCLLVSVLLALSGCSGLLHSTAPALQLYVLATPPARVVVTGGPPDALRRAAPTLRVARALPSPGLNTDRIALLRPGNRLDYYAGSRWSAPLADLVADLELAVLREDPDWGAVADDRSSFNTDYLLQTSVDRFTAEYATESQPPDIRVELHVLLIRRSDGSLVGSFAVSEQARAKENRMASVIAAFSAVAGEAISAVQMQSAQLLRSAKSPATP
ncbi:MAG TPA: ABC-type transport auxiliary lipoprotein family protein [Steroidobacteraceae bacterium]